MADSIYFRAPADAVLYIHQFISSTVAYPAGVLVTQEAGYPASTTSTTTITVRALPVAASTMRGSMQIGLLRIFVSSSTPSRARLHSVGPDHD